MISQLAAALPITVSVFVDVLVVDEHACVQLAAADQFGNFSVVKEGKVCLQFSNWEEISLFLHWVLVMFTGHAVLWESRSRVMKCQMSLNVKCHEMYNVLKCKML